MTQIKFPAIIGLVVLTALLAYCANPSDGDEAQEIMSLTNYDLSDVARFTISKIMGSQPESMSVSLKEDVYHVSYTRDDGKKFSYKVQFHGENFIVWGTEDRWRYEDVLRFYEIEGKLRIEESGVGYQDFEK